MISERYKGQYVTASADYDLITLSWIPKVVIFWSVGHHPDSTFFPGLGTRFPRQHEAEQFGIAKGKEWVDRQLGEG